MTVYSQIASNKAKTVLIISLFIIILSGLFFLIGNFVSDPGTFFVIGVVISLFSSVGSYFYSDKIVLATTQAKPVTKEEYFDLYTVVENLSIAGGIPMPRVFVIEDSAPNAFATGRNPKNAVVVATTGLLNRLDRAELEGVIAHELSHVKNYDILVSSIVGVLVGTIALVSDWVMRSMMWGGIGRDSDSRENKNPLLYIFFILVLLITPLVASIIQLAVSRKREYLADASGALLSRHPAALARALQKIADDPQVLKTASTSTAHLFIANPFKKTKTSSWVTSLFSTHPPIEDRIRILMDM
ncbi:MAG: M48 family metallopeptidase [Patescibacteria group bacterium]